jgi:hypothetical protein
LAHDRQEPKSRRPGTTLVRREEKRRKWLHHATRVLSKELKKAKTFETRKVMRRIKEATDAASEDGSARARVGAS